MNKSEQINELIGALAKAQAGLSAPEKNRSVEVSMKSGGKYSFRYTTLDYIIEHVRAALTANGIWFVQTLEQSDGKYRLITTLAHSSGQWIASETPLMVDGGNNQAFGSALSYMRRYALQSILGLCSEEDDDGNAGDGNEARERGNAKPEPKKPATDAKLEAAKKFTDQAIVEIGSRKNGAEVDEWLSLNAKMVAALKSGYPDLYAYVDGAMKAQRGVMANG